jgi:RNA polymerase sigma factor (TIGR02999 family)
LLLHKSRYGEYYSRLDQSTPETVRTAMKSEEITQLLVDWRNGDPAGFDKLYSLVYDELHYLASRYMRRERADHTLQTTALVHEAYVRLVRQSDATLNDRTHFFAVAAKVMRQILIDHARSRNFDKRGGNAQKISLEEAAIISDERAEELIILDRALVELEKIDPRQSQIVELRYFGGMTLAETGDFLQISADTVTRDWNVAKAWLYRQIHG